MRLGVFDAMRPASVREWVAARCWVTGSTNGLNVICGQIGNVHPSLDWPAEVLQVAVSCAAAR